MKARLRVLKGKGMKFFVETIILFSWAGITFAQSPCDPSQLIPVWSRLEDSRNFYGPHYEPGPMKYLNTSYDSKKWTPQLNVGVEWMKGYFEGIRGSKEVDYQFRYEKGFTHDEMLRTDEWFHSTGIISYSTVKFISGYYGYCSGSRMGQFDGPSYAEILFNRFSQLAQPFFDFETDPEEPYQINGKPVFKIPTLTKSQGRVDYYQYPGPVPDYIANYGNWDFLDVFVIRNSEKPLFIPFTRKEFLEFKLTELEKNYLKQRKGIVESTQIYPPEVFDRELEERIQEIKKLTTEGAWGYSKENMENRIRMAEENTRLKKKEELIKIPEKLDVLEKDYLESLEIVREYLQTQPDSILKKSFPEMHQGISGAYSMRTMIEKFDPDYHGQEWGNNTVMVYINPDYFDTKIPLDVPQLITVEFVNLEGVHKHLNEVVDRINQKMDFKALQALFPNVNMAGAGPPISQPIQVKTKKPGRYLEKLEELGPYPYPSSQSKANTVTLNFGGPGFNATPIQVKFPEKPSALGSLPNLSTSSFYDSYLAELGSKFLAQLTEEQKGTFDRWIRDYDLKTVEEFTQMSMLSWINSNPKASIYLDFEAVKRFPTSGLAANNLAVHLLKSGYPDKSLPILNYWLKEFPDNSLLLGNAATANYYLGDVEKAFQLAKLTVEQDSLHPNANKILAFVHHRKGEKEPAKKASERSLEGSYDEEVVALLQEIDPEGQAGDAIYKGRKRPYTPQLLEKFKMPEAIQSIDEAEDQSEVIEEVLGSIELTLAAIPRSNSELTMQQTAQKNIQQVMSGRGIPIMQMLGQHMYFKSLQQYQEDYKRERDRFVSKLKKLSDDYSIIAGNISRQYDTEMFKIEGGEDYEGERKLAELAKSKCNQLNLALDEYYKETAPLINQAVVRLELISRDHHSTVAYWAPIWLQSQEAADFPGTQINYLRDMRELLSLYPTELPIDCELFEVEEEDENVMPGKILVWEDQFCPVKYTVSAAVAKMGVNCNTFSLSGGEFFQVELEVKLNNDWDTIEEVTAAAGIGVSLDVGMKNVTMASAGLSSKGFLKLSKDPKSLEWNFREIDAGVKTEATVGGEIGRMGGEIKMVEVGMGFRSGITADGVINKGIEKGINFGVSN
jgi:hypothetical protein